MSGSDEGTPQELEDAGDGTSAQRLREYEQSAILRIALRRFESASERAARGQGLTDVQYVLLLLIKVARRRDDATVSKIAARLQLTPSTVTALVNISVAKGLIERVQS